MLTNDKAYWESMLHSNAVACLNDTTALLMSKPKLI